MPRNWANKESKWHKVVDINITLCYNLDMLQTTALILT